MRGEDSEEPAQPALDGDQVDNVRFGQAGLRARHDDVVDLDGENGPESVDRLAGKRRKQRPSGLAGSSPTGPGRPRIAEQQDGTHCDTDGGGCAGPDDHGTAAWPHAPLSPWAAVLCRREVAERAGRGWCANGTERDS